jgi:hypothetical protein
LVDDPAAVIRKTLGFDQHGRLGAECSHEAEVENKRSNDETHGRDRSVTKSPVRS